MSGRGLADGLVAPGQLPDKCRLATNGLASISGSSFKGHFKSRRVLLVGAMKPVFGAERKGVGIERLNHDVSAFGAGLMLAPALLSSDGANMKSTPRSG